jgi:WD40-like Beta Propeller Repeat
MRPAVREEIMKPSHIGAVVALVGLAAVGASAVGPGFGPWSAAVNEQSNPGTHPEVNTAFTDGCPTLARDGRTLYMASNRPGGEGGLDIWVSTRESAMAPWGEPVNLGPPVNTAADEFCPSPARDGHLFFFVSTRPGGCGSSDIYMSRRRDEHHPWDDPINLGCELNSAGGEASPFLLEEPAAGQVLYFSSNRAGGYSAEAPDAITGDDDLYSAELHGQYFLPPALIPGVNSPFNDSRPNLRRDGLELLFDSNQEGTLGGADIFSAVRASVNDLWSIPEPLGPLVNSTAAETRASLSWDGTTLVFGSTRPGGEGSTDIYMTTRARITGRP